MTQQSVLVLAAMAACSSSALWAQDQGTDHFRATPAFTNTYRSDAAPASSKPPEKKFSHEIQLSGATDFVYRGTSLTSGHGSILGGYDAKYALTKSLGLAGGTWVASSYNHGVLERPVYAYWATASATTKIANFSVNEFYLDVPADDDLFTVEFTADGKAKIAAGASLTWLVALSPHDLSSYGNTAYVSTGFQIDAAPGTLGIAVAGHVGREWVEDHVTFGTPDYTEVGLTFSKSWAGFDAVLAASATDVHRKDCFDGTRDCDPRIVFSVSRAIALK